MFVPHFTLPEELLLLAHDPVEGRVACRTYSLRLGIAGAVAGELVLAGRVEVRDGKIVASGAPVTGDSFLDAALAGVAGRRKGHRLQRWVRDTAGVKTSAGRTDEVWRHRLVARGALREERTRTLGVIAQRRHVVGPDDRTSPARERVSAVAHGATGDERARMLAALVGATGLAENVLPGDGLSQQRIEVTASAGQDPIARAVGDLVREREATPGRARGGESLPESTGPGWNPLSWIFDGDGSDGGGD
ncbi:GPP34 family phosphoprotein [Streptomyces sp. NBC_00726]|uniref:GOLPH3/VPS74 family protein n=1 Tax=Streptomyces sp. NBC_00726 TaxID=2903674 RepID=UPI0038646FF5